MDVFSEKLSALPGVGPKMTTVLQKELNVSTYGELLRVYPFRYEDRSHIHQVAQLFDYVDQYVQLIGTLSSLSPTSFNGPLRANFQDDGAVVELIWFQRTSWISKQLKIGQRYLLYGKLCLRGKKCVIVHPELSSLPEAAPSLGLVPVYSSSELMRRVGLHSKGLARLQSKLLPLLLPHLKESFPESLREAHALMSSKEAFSQIHFPRTQTQAAAARRRLCFEELFFLQLHLRLRAQEKKQQQHGFLFSRDQLLQTFYEKYMPFSLTEAQQRVIREIHTDLRSGYPMNRLLQGDVGSGKTIVAWMSLLIALSNERQVALMVPTEVLATQHASLLLQYAAPMNISVEKLSSMTTKKSRTSLLSRLASGQLQVLVGTHALLEPDVRFSSLGLVIIDEQHRFGVAQRAVLSEKCQGEHPPHILVMTATPIPRTLSLTQYGELDISLLDELPKGRKPIRTVHRTSSAQEKVYAFMREQLSSGHRGYIVYPLIEESEQLDLRSLSEGYAHLQEVFVGYTIEQLHGRMPSEEKHSRMHRFTTGEAQLLVSTTVIEVGLDVPEANLMLIHHADRFGLVQLHQLRGRVGRGTAESYCILMTEGHISSEARKRIQAMVRTQDGFELAEIDLQERGPGNMLGTQQSGLWQFEIADLSQDEELLLEAQQSVKELLEKDPDLSEPSHEPLLSHLSNLRIRQKDWMKVG